MMSSNCNPGISVVQKLHLRKTIIGR